MTGDNYVICTLHKTLLGSSNQSGWDRQGM